MTTFDSANSPDALIKDENSKVFFILRDEQVAICKNFKDLPYWQNRSTYLSAGRFSPEYKKVVFYPDPINPGRAIHLLKENCHIEGDYTYAIAGSTTRAPKTKTESPVDKLDGVRKRQVEVLMQKGMRQQVRENNSEETKESKVSDQ